MANAMTRSVREGMIDMYKLDIPYNSVGFVKWLTENTRLTDKEAEEQVNLIRQADIDLWEPGDPDMSDPEIFELIKTYIIEGKNAKFDSVKELMYEFAFAVLDAQMETLEDMRDDIEESCIPFLNRVLEAYKYYRIFLKYELDYIPEYQDEEDIEEEDYAEKPASVRYESVPLEDEFKQYLIDSHYPPSTRYKMVSNLRKLNSLVINNERGDSNWLQSLVDKALNGLNIRYARLTADRLVHNTMNNINGDDNLTIDTLRGGLSSLNSYLDFLISTYCKKKNP